MTIILGHMPEKIVFGGGVTKGPGLIERVREKTRRLLGGYVQAKELRGDLSSYITLPALGDFSAVMGAFAMAEGVGADAG